MKKRSIPKSMLRITIFLLSALLILNLIGLGCSSSYKSDDALVMDDYYSKESVPSLNYEEDGYYEDYYDEYDYDDYDDYDYDDDSPGDAWDAPQKEAEENVKKIITNGYLHLIVDDTDEAVDIIVDQLESMGGYLSQSEFGQDSKGDASVDMELKIPFDRFYDLLAFVEEQGVTRSKSISTEDITEKYFDIISRLKHAKKQEEQLLEIMEEAETIEDILMVKYNLDNVQERIEELQGKINLWDSLVSMSTLEVQVRMASRAITEEDSLTLITLEEIWSGIKRGLESGAKGTFNFLAYIIVMFFYLLIPGLIILGIVLLILLIIRRHRKKHPRKARKSKASNKNIHYQNSGQVQGQNNYYDGQNYQDPNYQDPSYQERDYNDQTQYMEESENLDDSLEDETTQVDEIPPVEENDDGDNNNVEGNE